MSFMRVAKRFGDECVKTNDVNGNEKNCEKATMHLAKHILKKIFMHHGIDAENARLSEKHINLLNLRSEGIQNTNMLEQHHTLTESPMRHLLGQMYRQVHASHSPVGVTLTDNQFKSVMKLMEGEWGKLAKKDFNRDGNLCPREFEAYLAESATVAEWLQMQARRDEPDLLVVEPHHHEEVSNHRMWVYGLGAYAILLAVLAGYLFCRLSKLANKLKMANAMDNIQVTSEETKKADDGMATTISLQKTGKYDFATIS